MKSFSTYSFAVTCLILATSQTAAGDALTTIEPCSQAPSLSIQPITVTSQYQPVSTCNPKTACVKHVCSTIFPLATYAYVSTVVPCSWDGTTTQTTTVTDTSQILVVSEYHETIQKTTAAPTANSRCSDGGLPNGSVPAPTVIPETITRQAVAPFDQVGPIAIPSWDGSGLCSECQNATDGSQTQVLGLLECRSGTYAGAPYRTCTTWNETWVKPSTPSTSVVQALCPAQVATQEPESDLGTMFPAVSTITIPGSTRTQTLVVDANTAEIPVSETISTILTVDPVSSTPDSGDSRSSFRPDDRHTDISGGWHDWATLYSPSLSPITQSEQSDTVVSPTLYTTTISTTAARFPTTTFQSTYLTTTSSSISTTHTSLAVPKSPPTSASSTTTLLSTSTSLLTTQSVNVPSSSSSSVATTEPSTVPTTSTSTSSMPPPESTSSNNEPPASTVSCGNGQVISCCNTSTRQEGTGGGLLGLGGILDGILGGSCSPLGVAGRSLPACAGRSRRARHVLTVASSRHWTAYQ